MKPSDFKVNPKLYELPYMFAFWVSDPEYISLREAAQGIRILPLAWIFLGDSHAGELTLRVDEEDPDELITSYRLYLYEIDGPEIVMKEINPAKNESPEFGEPIRLYWALTRDGRFSIKFGEDFGIYVPTTVEGLEDAGFGTEILMDWIDDLRAQGGPVVEKFDTKIALELIAEIQAEEDKGL